MKEISQLSSLIWGERQGGDQFFETISPLDGSVVMQGWLLENFHELGRRDRPEGLDLGLLGGKLADGLASIRSELIDALRLETGFVRHDCQELVDSALFYARSYDGHPSTQLSETSPSFASCGRKLALVEVAVGTVAVILPQNAFLPLAVTCLMNGLRAGNRVILRSPTHSARSASLLAAILESIPELSRWVSVVTCAAVPFVDWFLTAEFPGLLHFFGSSRRAAELVSRGFDAGKSVLIDGEGNVWVYVDLSHSAMEAAELLSAGAFRYNGQTCTSINGAMVHPQLFDEVAELVARRARSLKAGPAEGDEVGAVFNERQAEWCLDRVSESGGHVVAGGSRQGAFVAPTIVLKPDPKSDLVVEGIFGPVLWIAPGNEADFLSLWPTNRYPLCAGIFEVPARPAFWASGLPNTARLVLNGDPSIEDPFEYWGGYAPAGQNPVSDWPSKYRRTVQIEI